MDIAFLGADGVAADFGLCEASAEQAYLKDCIIRRAASVVVLADADKLGRARQRHWMPRERDWSLITTTLADEIRLALERVVVEVAPMGVEEVFEGCWVTTRLLA